MQPAHDHRVIHAAEDRCLSFECPQGGFVVGEVGPDHLHYHRGEQALVEAGVGLVGVAATESALHPAAGDEFIPRCQAPRLLRTWCNRCR